MIFSWYDDCSHKYHFELSLTHLAKLFKYAELKTEQFSQLQTRYMELLGTIRTYAVNLVDSFDFRDEALGSALGCWDGNVYQRLFDVASKSPLNQTADHKESFEKYLKPLMHSNL